MPSPFSNKPGRRFRTGTACANIEVIIAAHRRGWTDEKIALAAGVSHQAINAQLKKHGEIRGKTRKTNNIARTYFKCRHCGNPFWIPKGDRFQNTKFCSMTCSGSTRRLLTERDIETAIEYRRQGKLWNTVADHFEVSVQCIQKRIWIHLFERQLLTPKILGEIWVFRSIGRLPAWNWLEGTTGIIASRDGGRLLPDKPYFPSRSPDGIFRRHPKKRPLWKNHAITSNQGNPQQ